MSIFPAVDLVTEVARAADPQRLRAATLRLNGAAQAPGFAQSLGAASRPPQRAAIGDSRPLENSGAPSAARATATKFEAFVLQGWLEILLPRETGGSFGTGPSADVWRSMMAEQLAAEVARAGGLGLNGILNTWTDASSA